MLAGVVLTGRVEEVLRGAGRPDVADAWHQGSAAGRAAALDALWDTSARATPPAAPTADEVSVMLAATLLTPWSTWCSRTARQRRIGGWHFIH